MSEVGEYGHRRRWLEACGSAIILCLLLAPGALAQRAWHLKVRQTAPQSLTLIKPSDPAFEGMIDTYYPGYSSEPGYQTSIKPFLVLVRNDTALPAVAYAIRWRLHYTNCSVQSLHAIYVNRHLLDRGAMTYLPPGDFRLIAPMFNVTPKEYELYKPSYGWYPANSFPLSKGLSSVDVNVDGVVYSDGTFIGPDKTRVLQRYVMAKFAERDEILAALNLINSSAGESPLTVVGRLEKMLNDDFQFSQRAYKHTLLALYVRYRGASATDISGILQDRGLAGMEKLLRRIVPAGNSNPSAFGRVYQNLSDNDPSVFGITPERPPEGSPPSPAAVAAAVAAGQPFTLTIAAPKASLAAGCPLRLLVTVTNTWDRPANIPLSARSNSADKIYQIHVLDSRGRPLSPLPKGNWIWAGDIGGTELKPGQSVKDRVNVSYTYDLSRPEKYKIWIAEPYYRGPHRPTGLAKSNVVTVTVVKQASAPLAPHSPGQKPPITLRLEAPKTLLKAGQQLLLRLKITNISDRMIGVGLTAGEALPMGLIYQVYVCDQRGHAVPRRPPPPPPPHPKGTVVVNVPNIGGVGLNPGQSVIDRIPITSYFDLDRPGKYRIWIRDLPSVAGYNVKSNVVIVTVVK